MNKKMPCLQVWVQPGKEGAEAARGRSGQEGGEGAQRGTSQADQEPRGGQEEDP